MMSGTLVSAAHTLAHSQLTAEQEFDGNHEHVDDDAYEKTHKGDESPSHSEDSHDTNEHGAELHFTAIDIADPTMTVAVPRGNLNASYIAIHSPEPQLPPDPYPDRA